MSLYDVLFASDFICFASYWQVAAYMQRLEAIHEICLHICISIVLSKKGPTPFLVRYRSFLDFYKTGLFLQTIMAINYMYRMLQFCIHGKSCKQNYWLCQFLMTLPDGQQLRRHHLQTRTEFGNWILNRVLFLFLLNKHFSGPGLISSNGLLDSESGFFLLQVHELLI